MTPLLAAGLLDELGINPVVLGTQVVIFVATFVILSRLLFGRVLESMTQRERETKQAQEGIEKDRDEAARMTREYEARIAKTDREAYDRMQTILKDAQAASGRIVAEAQTEAKENLDKARQEIRREKEAAMTRLRGEVTRLAIGVVEKVLETKLDTATHGAIAEKFVAERK